MTRHSGPIAPILALILAAALGACGAPASEGTTRPALTPSPSQPKPPLDATPGAPASSPPASQPGAAPRGTPSSSDAAPASPSPSTAPAESPSGTMTVRAYFHLDGYGLVPVLRDVARTSAPGRAAMEELLRGPGVVPTEDPVNISTSIPSTTRLLGLSIEDGTATVDLSSEFEGGGGSASTVGRLQQVVFTLTQFSTVDRVAFRVEGQDVMVFGSEGLVLEQPQTRDDFLEYLPAIWTDRPAWAAAMASGSEVSGLANVHEATLHVAVLDEDGDVLFDQPVTATCGTGCWGSFSVVVDDAVAAAEWGRLRTYSVSSRDGSPEQVHDRPVWLTP